MKNAFLQTFIILLISALLSGCAGQKNSNDTTDTPLSQTNTVESTLPTDAGVKEKFSEYTDAKNGFEMIIPKDYVELSESRNGNEDGCIEGEIVNFYVYQKNNAPENLDGYVGTYEFTGTITSSNYKQFENNKKDGSFCGPVYDEQEYTFKFKPQTFTLDATSLKVLKPIQAPSCEISQELQKTNQNGDTLTMSNPIKSIIVEGEKEMNSLSTKWQTQCPNLFEKNNSPDLQKKIIDFDKIAKSVDF